MRVPNFYEGPSLLECIWPNFYTKLQTNLEQTNIKITNLVSRFPSNLGEASRAFLNIRKLAMTSPTEEEVKALDDALITVYHGVGLLALTYRIRSETSEIV